MSMHTIYYRPGCPQCVESIIQDSIKPVLVRADRLIWELDNPRHIPGRHSEDWDRVWQAANPPMRQS